VVRVSRKGPAVGTAEHYERRSLAADLKRTSVLRRVPALGNNQYLAAPGLEGDVCAFMVMPGASPIVVEAETGRAMTLVPGDIFLATPGHRESTRWVVGGIPDRGLIPGGKYWVLAESGVIGDLVGASSREKGHLGQIEYLGTVCNDDGEAINIRQFAATFNVPVTDHGAALFLVLGTSAEVGKTTAGIAVLRALRHKGHANVIALKATGTSSFTEITRYRDFGAAQVFDCVDFGLPTTYPSDREGMIEIFEKALNICLSVAADGIVVECGGDIFGANVPVFLDCLKGRRFRPKVILVAPDTLAALGAKRVLHEIGYSIDLITGPCTDTPTLQARTQAMCGIPAVNMADGGSQVERI
jgi:hypothetical protein